MGGFFRVLLLCAGLILPDVALAQGLTALARVDADRSELVDTRRGVEMRLGLSQAVPFRVFTLEAPSRLVLDFSDVA